MTDNIEKKEKEDEIQEKPEKEETKKSSPLFSRHCRDCEKFKKEMEEYKSGWQRALADYKNLQRETGERRAEWARMSETQILEEFIPVYDNFKKAFGVEHNNFNSEQAGWVKGIEYIMKQFGDVLRAHGIEEIKTVGEKFNTAYHDAAGEEDSDQESGMIVREVSAGYRVGDHVIRAARVIVAK
ncbi:MAG TPA: nucleotide exchange factor GrpE [Candidatus Magasanikbacteria bacterium]|nr:nucleotide exchange factor GrpE [Candidatus Magasanikbacteria bacterium]